MNQPWYDRFLDKIVSGCRILLLAFLTIVIVQALYSYDDAEFLVKTQSKGTLIFCVLAMALFLFLFFGGIYRLFTKAGAKVLKAVCILAPCLLVVGQLVFLLYYRSLYMWDSAYVVGGASALLNNGKVADEALYYYSIYPNQNAFALVTEGLLWLAGHLGLNGGESLLFCNAVNMLAIDAAIMFGMLLWRRIKPEFSTAQWAFVWIVIVFQPFFYMGVSYYYTITLSLPFVMAFLYMAVVLFSPREVEWEYTSEHIKDHKTIRHLIWVAVVSMLAGICFALGFLMRATMIIPLIAVIFCAFLAPRFKEAFVVDNKRIRKLLISLLIVVTSVAVLAVVKPLMQKEIGIDTTDTAFPATHWVMMSLTSPGCHNAEDEAYTASFATAGQKSEAVLARLKEKLKELGGTGYFLLVLEKIRNTWASGANNYVLFMENCLRMDGIYPYLFGNHKDFMIVYHQGMYLLILVGIFISVVHGMFQRDNQERDIFVLQLVLLGAFLFYVLWETSGQYSLPFFIIMLLLAIDGYEAGMQRKTHIPYRIRLMHNHANRLIENDRGTLYKTLAVAAGVVIIMLFAFFIRNAALFTEKTDTYKAPVVNQLIANGETDYKGTEAITQTFRTKDSFNQLIFQWRNPIGENNSAQYLVTLSDAEQNVLWEQPMIAAAQGYAGAFSYDFASIVPDGEEEFILSITKTAGAEGDYLAFVKYSCGSYDPYPFGTFTIAGAVQEGDLLLQAARVEQKTYTTKKHYVIFAGVCMISFLFLEFCCILILSAIHTSNGNQMNQ